MSSLLVGGWVGGERTYLQVEHPRPVIHLEAVAPVDLLGEGEALVVALQRLFGCVIFVWVGGWVGG